MGLKLRSLSLPNFLSGIPPTHSALVLDNLLIFKESPLLNFLCSGYTKAAGAATIPTTVLISIPVHMLHSLSSREVDLELGSATASFEEGFARRGLGGDGDRLRDAKSRGIVNPVRAD